MGLNVVVGAFLSFDEDPEALTDMRTDFAAVNEVLREHGLPEHHEPERADWEPVDHDMWGYSGLHYLRRVAAHLAVRGEMPDPGTQETVDEDDVMEQYYDAAVGPTSLRGIFRRRPQLTRRFDHLMQHSDAEGFYVPIPFDDVIGDDRLVGTLLGSSQRLESELAQTAEALELPADLDPHGDAVLAAAEEQGVGEGWRAYGVESLTCVQLLDAARASVSRGAAVVFT
jgi:hypothetical protein